MVRLVLAIGNLCDTGFAIGAARQRTARKQADYTVLAGLGKINRTCVEKIVHVGISGTR
jgi:hypothetical protein